MASESFAPAVMAKLMKEIRALHDNPIEGITLLVSEDSLSSLHADLDGPIGTPFEGGRFRIKLGLPSDYPSSPPKGFFLTKIFHPNVSASGEICVNTLKKDWKATHGLRHVLLVVHCLLIQPNPESALNEEAGKLLMEAYEEYAKRARLMTRIHALPKVKPAHPSKADSGEPEEADEESGQENTPATSANSPNHASSEGKRGAGGKEEECKASPKKRPVVQVKGGDKGDKAKPIKKSIKRL